MRPMTLIALILVTLWPLAAAAQAERPRENTVAIGGDVGFLAADTGESTDEQALQSATGTVDVFVEYYYTPRASLRAMYGWAAPEFESVPDFPELTGKTLTAFTWTFGIKVPF